jgi:uncharacterized membrane protein/putative flippase GtrA
MIVHMLAVYGLVERGGVHYSAASLVAGIAGVLWNFLLNDLLVWRGRRTRGLLSWIAAAGKYALTRTVGLGAGLTGTVILVELGRVHYLVANLAAAAVGSVLGFLMADRLVWPEPRDARDCRRDEGDPYSARLRLLVLGVTAVLSTLSILSYVGYQSSAGDLGQYVYMFERTLRRDGFLPLPYYRAGKNEYFAAHFAPLLVVFLPVYAALPSAVTLLVAKSVLLGASVWLFGLLARELVRSATIALLLTAGYAFNPFLWNAWLFDFQEQVLIPPLLFGAVLALERRRIGVFIAALVAALLSNELVGILVAGWLLGVALEERKEQHNEPILLALAGFSIVYVGIAHVIMKHFWGAVSAADRTVLGRDLGVADITRMVLTTPAAVLELVTRGFWEKVVFFVAFGAPVGLVGLLRPSALLGLGPYLLFAWAFAGEASYRRFEAHYPLYLAPLVHVAFVRWIKGLGRGATDAEVLRYLLRATLVLSAAGCAGVLASQRWILPWTAEYRHVRVVERALELVPWSASLLTQNDIYPRVARRPRARVELYERYLREYEQLVGPVEPEYVVVDRKMARLGGGRTDWSQPIWSLVKEKVKAGRYGIYAIGDGVTILRRGWRGHATVIGGEGERSVVMEIEGRELLPESAFVERSELVGNGERGLVWFGPYVALPRGRYEGVFELAVERNGASDQAVIKLDIVGGLGRRVYAQRRLRIGAGEGWREVVLRFELGDGESDLELRGWKEDEGRSRLRVRRIVVRTVR